MVIYSSLPAPKKPLMTVIGILTLLSNDFEDNERFDRDKGLFEKE